MKKFRLIILSIFTLLSLLVFSHCGGPGTVSVGVGVGGPWVGPYGYPGGTVWVGRPMGPPVYYHLDPIQEDGREWVENQPGTSSLEIVQ
jgi:hypothetical protein